MNNNEDNKNTNKTEEKKLGVYLILKTSLKKAQEIFDYSSKTIKNINTFINKKTCINIYGNDIYRSKECPLNKEELLLDIKHDEKGFYIDNCIYNNNKPLNFDNIRKTVNFLWYVVNSESSTEIMNPNKDYYLEQGDIIKFGRVKYLVREIYIKNENPKNDVKSEDDNKEKINIIYEENNNKNEANKGKNKEIINNYIPECSKYKLCEYCNKYIFRFCKCQEFQHLKCIENWINEAKERKINLKENVTNYTLNIYYCEDYIEGTNSGDSINEDSECKKCNTYYPLIFKYFDKNKNEFIYKNLFEYSKPEDSNYMILESLETNGYYDSDKNKKFIHVIQLTKDEINIGRDNNNDVIIKHSSVCSSHAVIKYINGKILLKNKSKNAGTLVLIQKQRFDLNEKEVFLQAKQTFIKAKVMEEKDYLKSKHNENSVYPLPDKNKINEDNNSMQNSDNNSTKDTKDSSSNSYNSNNFENIQNINNKSGNKKPSRGAIFYNGNDS